MRLQVLPWLPRLGVLAGLALAGLWNMQTPMADLVRRGERGSVQALGAGAVTFEVIRGSAVAELPGQPTNAFACAITSPPYWSLRDYGGDPCEVGSEDTPEEYVARLVKVFRLLRPLLTADGCLWLNLGDSFAASGKGGGGTVGAKRGSSAWAGLTERKGFRMPPPGFKMKDLTLSPFAVADALRRDGWYLRQTVIWAKPSAVEPPRLDRPATSHEYVFLLAKAEHYATRNPGEPWWAHSVWTINPEPYAGHPAAMPQELVRRCLLSSSRRGDCVIDPFCGSGTVGVVALRNGRRFVGIDLSEKYARRARRRIVGPLFSEPSGQEQER